MHADRLMISLESRALANSTVYTFRHSICAESCKQMVQFNSQALANTAWAFATLLKDYQVMDAICAESWKKMVQFKMYFFVLKGIVFMNELL